MTTYPTAEQVRAALRNSSMRADGSPAAPRPAVDFAGHDRRRAEAAKRLLAWCEVEHGLPAGRLTGNERAVLIAKQIAEQLAELGR